MEQEIIICEYCGRPIKNNPLSKSGHYRVCKKHREFKKTIIKKITKDFLYEEYIVKELSASKIARDLGLKKHTEIIKKLKEYGIHVRTLAETRKTKGYINATKETCRKKYNADYHTCKNSNKREEIDDAVKIKYNVNNVFQLEWVKDKAKLSHYKKHGVEYISQSKYWSERVKQTCNERYGFDNPAKVPEFIEKGINTKNSKERVYTYSSRMANRLFSELRKHIDDNKNIYCAEKGKEFGKRIKETGRYVYYDFVDTQNKKCIEFNGNYYHANPTMYAPNYFNKKRQQTAQEIWKSDFEKLQRLEADGFEIKVVWESEFTENPETIINECIFFLNN
ncbi:MAG TPA: hypothetical protein P5509_04620 [Bacteroidales bacterium]|nr:hypothetical protein [Bacteroidales bacterium]